MINAYGTIGSAQMTAQMTARLPPISKHYRQENWFLMLYLITNLINELFIGKNATFCLSRLRYFHESMLCCVLSDVMTESLLCCVLSDVMTENMLCMCIE